MLSQFNFIDFLELPEISQHYFHILNSSSRRTTARDKILKNTAKI